MDVLFQFMAELPENISPALPLGIRLKTGEN